MLLDHLRDLLGSHVVGLDRVEDYVQLVLDRASISLFNPLLEPQRVDEWRAQLPGTVLDGLTILEEERIEFIFSNGSRLIMSLRPDDYVCPDAAVFYYRFPSRKVVVI